MSLPQNMIKKIAVFVFIISISWSGAIAQVITPVGERNELIDGMEQVVGNMDTAAPSYSGLASPFTEKTEPSGIVSDLSGSADIIEERLPEIISDQVAVEVISRRFKPIGSMIFGNRGILQLSNGETVEEGESFPAEIRGNIYTVEIIKVTSQGYTLKVGTATADKTFLKAVNQPGK
jgi:hypothetical protein